MATARRPYVKVLMGSCETALERVSNEAALSLFRFHTLEKGPIPGLQLHGPNSLAERMVRMKPAVVKRHAAELEAAALVLTDFEGRPPLLYVVGAAKADPPVTENAVRSMAAQLRDLPQASKVTRAVWIEIRDALALIKSSKGFDRNELSGLWLDLCPEPPGLSPDSHLDSSPDSGRESRPLRFSSSHSDSAFRSSGGPTPIPAPEQTKSGAGAPISEAADAFPQLKKLAEGIVTRHAKRPRVAEFLVLLEQHARLNGVPFNADTLNAAVSFAGDGR